MKSLVRCSVSGLALMVACAMPLRALAQENAKKATDPKGKTAKKGAKEEIRGRLPANWAKIGLSEEQKRKIYETQAKARERINSLEEKAKEIRAESRDRIAELEKQIRQYQDDLQQSLYALLTDEQRKKLEDVEAESEARAKARRKPAAPAKKTESTTEKGKSS